MHLFERNQLIFIIALGESILLLGGYLVGHEIHVDTGAAALIGFLLIVTLWWIYFVDLAEPGNTGSNMRRITPVSPAQVWPTHMGSRSAAPS